MRALIVPHDGFQRAVSVDVDDMAHIEESIRNAMGSDYSVEVTITDRIKPSSSGKHLHHVSVIQ